MKNGIVKVVLSNIEYDTDGEIVNGLPTEWTINLKEPFLSEDNALVKAMDDLSNNTGWCIMHCTPKFIYKK